MVSMGWFMVEEWRFYRAGQRLRHQASMAGERSHIYEVRRRASDSQGTSEWHGVAENGDGAARTRCPHDLKE